MRWHHTLPRRFADRQQAGLALAEALQTYRGTPGLLVLGLPRGGVPVAFEVARALGAELDVLLVRKLGLPQQPELAMGAIASGGVVVLDQDIIRMAGVTQRMIESVTRSERAELERREQVYRHGRPFPPIRDRTVIVVDDGLATGASMKAAVQAIRSLKPERVVVAVPVAPAGADADFADLSDEFVCVHAPIHFNAVGQWYEQFGQTTDEEVRDLLRRAADGGRPDSVS